MAFPSDKATVKTIPRSLEKQPICSVLPPPPSAGNVAPSGLQRPLLHGCATAAVAGGTQGDEMMLGFAFSDLVYTQELH